MLLGKRALWALGASIVLLGCAPTRTPNHPPQPSAAADYRRLVPLDAAHLKDFYNLTPAEHRTLNDSMNLIREAYHSAIRYTFPSNGGFAVLVSYKLRGQKYWVVLSSCHSPGAGRCKHECGVGFNFQSWEALALMETGRCQDDAPIWKN